MKALSALKSAIHQSSFIGIIALGLITPVCFPQLAVAAELQTIRQPAIFEIKVTDPSLVDPSSQTSNSQNFITLDTIQQADPLTASLHNFLVQNNSPLADYTQELLSRGNWKQVLAISYVESQFCVHQLHNNCSGIGGQDYLRKYDNFGQWIDDMSTLLDSHYQGWTFAKMDGVYVQPYSPNWKLGAEQTYAKLTALEQDAANQRAALAQAQQVFSQSNGELATIAQ